MKSDTLKQRGHHGKGRIKPFSETAVLYYSPEDGCWIAHGLRTDQIGTGLDMGRALAALIRGIDSVLEIAAEDETVAYLREAPRGIQKMATQCKPLPNEIYEVAGKRCSSVIRPAIGPEVRSFPAICQNSKMCLA